MSAEDTKTELMPTGAQPSKGPSRAGMSVVGAAMVGVLGYTLLGSPMWKTPLAAVPIAQLGQPSEVAVTLPAGTRLRIPIHAARIRNHGADALTLDLDLLRAGQSVAQLHCAAWTFDEDATSTSATHYNDDCVITVPDGGATGARARLTLGNEKGGVSFDKLEVRLVP